MNKEDIINFLKKYNLDNTKYSVISGAAMVLYGIKEKTHDIDLYVNEDYYNFLLNNYSCTFEKTNEFGNDVYYIDDIINFGVNYKPDKIEYIEDIPVSSIEDIIKLKKYLKRDKDIKDLELIYKYLEDKND